MSLGYRYSRKIIERNSHVTRAWNISGPVHANYPQRLRERNGSPALDAAPSTMQQVQGCIWIIGTNGRTEEGRDISSRGSIRALVARYRNKRYGSRRRKFKLNKVNFDLHEFVKLRQCGINSNFRDFLVIFISFRVCIKITSNFY